MNHVVLIESIAESGRSHELYITYPGCREIDGALEGLTPAEKRVACEKMIRRFTFIIESDVRFTGVLESQEN